MVKRAFWIALGASAGVLVVTRGSRALKKLSPARLADNAAELPGAVAGGLRGFADEVRSAAAEREFELYSALGVDLPDEG